MENWIRVTIYIDQSSEEYCLFFRYLSLENNIYHEKDIEEKEFLSELNRFMTHINLSKNIDYQNKDLYHHICELYDMISFKIDQIEDTAFDKSITMMIFFKDFIYSEEIDSYFYIDDNLNVNQCSTDDQINIQASLDNPIVFIQFKDDTQEKMVYISLINLIYHW